MNRILQRLSSGFLASAMALVGIGCANTGESASADKLTANVGVYSPPPSNLTPARVGVPPFNIRVDGGSFQGGDTHDMDKLAADQMSSILHLSKRFEVIERAQIQQLLAEQNMEGIVKPEQMAKAGQVLGVEYLLLGKVTNFRIKADSTQSGLDVGGLTSLFGGKLGGGPSGFDKKTTALKTEVGVDIRLVDPTNGKVMAAHFGEFNRIDSADSLGISVLGFGAKGDASIQVSRDDAGRILRLAFDEALRKMLPEIDEKLAARTVKPSIARPAAIPAPAIPTPTPIALPEVPAVAAPAPVPPVTGAQKFCPECGKPVPAGSKFCPIDGTKIQ